MVKILLKINFLIIVVFFSSLGIVFASDQQINAGLLSDVWFSKLEIQNNDPVSIYGSFQNTSGKKLHGEVSFWVNDKELEKKNFNVEDGQVAKLETSWVVEVGEFDIKIFVNNLKSDGVDIATSSLIKNTALLKIKINRKIDIEYIKEVGTNVYNDTVKVINKVVDSANQSLETVKVREADSSASSTNVGVVDNSDNENGSVKGIQYSKDEVEGINNQNLKGENNVSGVVVTDLKNRPFDALWNFVIGILQFILKYWQISLGILLIIIVFISYFKRTKRY